MRYVYFLIVGLLLLFSANVSSQFIATTGYGGGAGPSPLLDSLFAYYSLEETIAGGGDALDAHGSNDLSVNGTVTREVTGKVNDCYTLITDAYLGEVDTDFEFPGTFSISFWVKSAQQAEYIGLISNFGASDYGYTVYIRDPGADGNGNVCFYTRNGGSSVLLYGNDDVTDDAWHHVVVSLSAVDDSSKLWVDGEIDDWDDNATVVYNANCRFTVGRRDGTGVSQWFLDGEMDEIAVYRGRELTEGAVDSLYNSGNGLAYPLDY
jgi:hypothetical protein